MSVLTIAASYKFLPPNEMVEDWGMAYPPKESWEPCVECGEVDGHTKTDRRTPYRAKGMCMTCYNRAAQRKYRKPKDAA